MANRKIIEFPELTDATNDDVLLIVDVSDLTESDEGTTKKIKKSNLSATVPLATSLVTGTVKTDITETDPIVYTKTTVDDLLDNVVHKTGDETIYGIKNFEDEITTDFGIEFRGIGAGIAYNQGEYNSNIKSKTLTTNRVIDFPDKDGVIALDVDLSLKANADGTILYHSVKWFTPSSTVSNVGATVTSVGTQFTSGMVGAKLIINGEQRIITAFTSSTVVTVASAYSTNYVGVVAGSWGVYSIMLYYDNANNVRLLRVNGGDTSLTVDRLVYTHLQGAVMMVTTDYNGILIGRDYRMAWSTNTNATTGAVADIAIRRNTAGTLEVFNGVTADGTLTNRRDLLVRNLLSNKALIGTTTDNGVDALQVNGTVSGSPATLSSQFVTKGQVVTQSMGFDYAEVSSLNTFFSAPLYNGSGIYKFSYDTGETLVASIYTVPEAYFGKVFQACVLKKLSFFCLFNGVSNTDLEIAIFKSNDFEGAGGVLIYNQYFSSTTGESIDLNISIESGKFIHLFLKSPYSTGIKNFKLDFY